METGRSATEKPEEAAGARGQQLDEAVERIGAAIEDRLSEPAANVEEKVVDLSGGAPDEPDR